MNKFVRYTRRLILWFERPLPREEWMSAFNLGKVAGRNELLREQGPITQVQPVQTGAILFSTIQPPTMRQRAYMQKLRATLVPMPQEIEPSPVLPAVQPIQFDKIIDESWLNDVPVNSMPVWFQNLPEANLSVVEEGPITERAPAMLKLLHGGNK